MQPKKYIAATLVRWQNWGEKFIEIRLVFTFKALILVMAGMIIALSVNLSRATQESYNPSVSKSSTEVEVTTNTPFQAEALAVVPESTGTREPESVPVSTSASAKAPKPVAGSTDETRSAYIRRFQKIAILEMEKFGIPASIKLAQAILESDAGQSRLAREANNHFGIKCKQRNCPRGHCMNYHDNSHKDFFLKYENAWASWRDHSKLLSNPDWRYAHMIKSCGNDYECWAKGLKKAGYAYPGKTYDQKLIKIIETYQLYRLDQKQLLFN